MKRKAAIPFRSSGRILVCCVALALSAVALPAHAEITAVPGEYIVKLKESTSPKLLSSIKALLQSGKMKFMKRFRKSKTLMHVSINEVSGSTFGELLSSGAIETIEPNWIFDLYDTPASEADPMLSELWGLMNHGQTGTEGLPGRSGVDVGVGPVWSSGQYGSPNVVVAVIDTGVDITHPDLKDGIFVNPGEIPGNGIDDDGNGYIDDVNGWNTIQDVPLMSDPVGHGTHVAGTIGARLGNGEGIVGVAPGVRILPIRATNRQATLGALIEALDYARIMKVDMINASWGGPVYSKLLEEAVQKVVDAGILLVAAAGNSAKDNDKVPVYPASLDLPGIISVAAVDRQGVVPFFSNIGALSVDIAAPGVGILSTVPLTLSPAPKSPYAERDGTSMAAPHVTGVAALVKSARPTMTAPEIRELLMRTAVKSRFLVNRVLSSGVVSAAAALTETVSPEPNRYSESAYVSQPYSLETPHPYLNSADPMVPVTSEYKVHVPGAKALRVHFASYDIDVFKNVLPVDWLRISDTAGFGVQEITGHAVDVVSEAVDGDTLVIRLTADAQGMNDGFLIDRVDAIF